MLLITPYSENECPGIILNMPEEREQSESGIKAMNSKIKAVH
jgi:hypothetical protein